MKEIEILEQLAHVNDLFYTYFQDKVFQTDTKEDSTQQALTEENIEHVLAQNQLSYNATDIAMMYTALTNNYIAAHVVGKIAKNAGIQTNPIYTFTAPVNRRAKKVLYLLFEKK